MSGRFLCLGECMLELSETQDGTYRRGFAGDTFNTAWYARRALGQGWSVAFGTCTGTDAVSDDMMAFMAAEGIDTSTIRRVPDRTLGLYMISLANGERSFSYWRSQSAARLLTDDDAWLRNITLYARHIHFSGITLAILSPYGRKRLLSALADARVNGTTISFDTNIRTKLWEDEAAMRAGLMQGAVHSNIVFPSFDEEKATFGDVRPSATADRYLSAGSRLVIVKNGPGSVLLKTGDGEEAMVRVTPSKSVIDTTAAGDSFAGTFLAHLLDGADPKTAAEKATAVASNVITHRGALIR
ncbi:MAG: 2-dehydro-3-deoxygluconokinase [Maritimibacter sp.]|nr:2-dehydro-3-deoxygluconokinase [Maritimibacter sp.]